MPAPEGFRGHYDGPQLPEFGHPNDNDSRGGESSDASYDTATAAGDTTYASSSYLETPANESRQQSEQAALQTSGNGASKAGAAGLNAVWTGVIVGAAVLLLLFILFRCRRKRPTAIKPVELHRLADTATEATRQPQVIGTTRPTPHQAGDDMEAASTCGGDMPSEATPDEPLPSTHVPSAPPAYMNVVINVDLPQTAAGGGGGGDVGRPIGQHVVHL